MFSNVNGLQSKTKDELKKLLSKIDKNENIYR